MRRAGNFLIPILIALLTIAAWALLNQPDDEPPWPSRIQGFSFAPMHADDDPSEHIYPSVEEIDADLALLQGDAYAVRTYTVEDTLAAVPRLAAAHDLNVTLGAWVGPDTEVNERELERLHQVLAEGYRNVVRVIVGNEAILRRDVSVATLMDYLDQVRKTTWLPVSTAEPWHVWLKYPKLAEHVDFITIHLLPYWEGVPYDEAVDYAISRYEQVKAAFPDKQVIIGEVGWPSNGRRNRGAEPSPANQTRFLRRFLAHAEAEGYVYYVMEAFDQPWKMKIEGSIGTYWGVYDVERQPKFTLTQPVVRIPDWQELAALSVLMAVLLLAFLYRDSATLSSKGKGFLAIVTYAISTAAVWIVYDYTRQYMTPATAVVGILLLLGGVGVIVLVSAEAHEWAESLWLRRWRRAFPRHQLPDDALPLVSVQVPAYNEPPELLIETLDALAALDYPRFEVLVIDNNTKDEAVWRPVEAHCARLGARFRFFHVAPLEGYKAGALNFALRHTHPDAEVVAVIDADYIVSPNWLRDLVPAFADPEVGIVQAPQDYRDADQNAFKAMCMAEYRGFFHIGMVTRNERNAIIQHGTMTMIRRGPLEDGGWSEWCITEDAELGLRVFEAGHKALYIPCTYGRGLMPDTFSDFKKQRYRWAYGAVRILIHHWRELFGLRKTALTAGQRYHFLAGWLPWFADGINLLFNLAALGWTVAMVMFPSEVTPPYITVALVPLVMFGFKMSKSFFLYRRRVTATLRQSLAAGLAGLALSHTISRAMFGALASGRLGFFRTPKLASAPAAVRALLDAREEALFVVALWLGAVLVLLRDDGYMLDVRIWAAVLLVQSIPYLASVVVSLISAAPRLPARLVGPMGTMECERLQPSDDTSAT
ncbi:MULTISPECIES: glycosyltransferase [Marichromatium]|uniref:Beta-monoglucosyldiacylglycerol synthase n=1 Tax=Marichromatium gracile TaxID=1048 RepID=A0A4R4AAK9_MARGR|nr:MULTISPECIES: glycosyltransferase [Marichromatium]MBO8085000.1 glycosyltransferase [Marichromatium sp.]MBK1708523.1 beta-(1-3)-glucosyl transferase [Marichromatium gracile]RNE89924.1 glycosyltransferase [Marichromatium sp. AB31]RNE94199.1 glycosyltransferase [Marichromatium sp. AB32]TCW35586.1 exo-beta-1,3-glucanase (GH17 family) [Marichromatium gracile]